MVLGRIWWFGRLKLDDYDLVITSSGNGEAFAVKTGPNTLHVNYCNTPTHYYWRHYDTYIQRPGFGIFDPLARLGLKLLVGPLRKWDYRAAQRADLILANSTHIQADIRRYYDRDSVVVFPPVDTDRFKDITSAKREGFVTAGRLATIKRTEIIVDACTELGLPLKVVGKGPAYDELVKRAGPTVSMLGFVDDNDLNMLLASSEAFLFAAHEDFGIAPIEAMAAGTPVLAYKAGGALDYVIPGQTGEFFPEQTVESLNTALQTFDPTKYNPNDIKTAANRFSNEQFHKNIHTVLTKAVQ
jgi:glycosyltransferase involved in cell wall biosynthesis